MKNATLSLAAALAAAGLFGAFTFAQDQAPATQISPAQGSDRQASPRPSCHPMGMGDAMMTRCPMMADAQLSPTSPEGVLALGPELNLSDEQAARLEQIAQQVQQQAEQVLTDQQRQQLQDLAEQSASMWQVHQEMMRRWQQRMDGTRGQDGAAMPIMCPWDAMMHQQMANKPDANGAAADPPPSQRLEWSPRHRMGLTPCCSMAAPPNNQ